MCVHTCRRHRRRCMFSIEIIIIAEYMPCSSLRIDIIATHTHTHLAHDTTNDSVYPFENSEYGVARRAASNENLLRRRQYAKCKSNISLLLLLLLHIWPGIGSLTHLE